VKRWWLVIALLLSVGVNVGILAAVATRRAARPDREMGREQPPLPPPGPGEGQPMPRGSRLADRLGLEGDQRRRFLDIQQRFFEEAVRLRLHLGETQRQVRRELIAAEPDRQRIDELLRASARDYLALEQALAKNVVDTREVLTPEQEEEFLRIVSRLRPEGPAGGLAPPQRRRLPFSRNRLRRRF